MCFERYFIIQISKFWNDWFSFMDIVANTIVQLFNAAHQMLDRFVQIINALQFSLQRWHNHLEYIQ